MTEDVSTKTCLVTGGCGFVGRHLVLRLLARGDTVWIIDNLSAGKYPRQWLPKDFKLVAQEPGVIRFGAKNQEVIFIQEDTISFFAAQLRVGSAYSSIVLPYFDDVFHLASVVGGRAVIDGNPMAVAIDLAIDALFFQWAVASAAKLKRILYASSSAAYPTNLQTKEQALALQESFIQLQDTVGMPDMTYGWSKLSGEYLAQIAAQRYGLSVVCIRPFSGYGGDQDTAYPIPAIAARVARREDPLVVWGTGEQGRDFVHIDDCIEAMVRAIEVIQDGRGINIGTGILTTFKQVATLFTELAGYQPVIKPLIDKPQGVVSRFSDTTQMKQQLQWQPTISLREGLTRVLKEQEALIV